jgi:hypothetical protein
MSNGLLGKAMSIAGSDVTVYTVPATAEFATVTLFVLNKGTEIATVNSYVTKDASPADIDLIGYMDELTADGGTVEYSCVVLGPGEKVVVKASSGECVVRVHGLEKLA